MNIWIGNMVLAFLTSVIFSGILIPEILLIAFRKKLFDGVDERKIHKGIVPRLGGVAFKPVILFAIFLTYGISEILGFSEVTNLYRLNSLQLSLGICALLMIYLIGVADDLIGVRYRAKFIVQIVSAILIVVSGLYFNDFCGLLGLGVIPNYIAYPFSLLIVVFIMNAINLLDGIDGLASGLSGIAFIYYGIFFYHIELYVYSIIAFASLGAVVPFFYYNVFGDAQKRRKIFMGDTGALTIGLILSFLALRMAHMEPEGHALTNPIVYAFSPLIVPCCDVVRVFFERLRCHKNPFEPDRSHIHHKFLDLGISHHWAMVLILLISLLLTVTNLLLVKMMSVGWLLLLDLAIWQILIVTLNCQIKRRNKK